MHSKSLIRLRVSFLFVFLIILSSFIQAQGVDYFFKDDFVYKSQVHRIKVGKSTEGYVTRIEYKDTSRNFTQFTLDKPNVFETNLKNCLDTLHNSKATNSTLFNPIKIEGLKILIDSVVIAKKDSFNLSLSQSIILNSAIDSISKIGQCQKYYYHDSIQQLIKITKLESLKTLLSSAMIRCQESEVTKKPELSSSSIESIVDRLFPLIIKAERVDPMDASLAGILYLEDTIKKIYKYDTIKKDWIHLDAEFVPDSAQLEFHNGTLLNTKVIGTITMGTDSSSSHKEIFYNNIPLPYSTKTSTNFLFRGKFKNRANYFLKSTTTHLKHSVNISDVIFNNYNLLLNTENYAPKDQVVILKPGARGTPILKEQNAEILKVKVYTDLVGLNNDRPNGLLQMEFSKKMNLLTRVFSNAKQKSRAYWHYFNFVEPILTISKIEDDDSVLQINSVPELSEAKVSSFNDILRFRTASLGSRLNLFNWGLPAYQSNFQFNVIGNFGLTTVRSQESRMLMNSDSIATVLSQDTTYSLLSHDWGFEFTLNVNPSDKYSLSLTYSPQFHRVYSDLETLIPVDNNLKVSTKDVSGKIDQGRKFHHFELAATARLSERGDLFFRGRYHFLSDESNQNFFQLQLGYSFFFFSQNK